LDKLSFPSISKDRIDILQVNIGYKCNQACSHCHVNASPTRSEMMDDSIMSIIPKVITKYEIKTLDITGGAPELHPRFKDLIINTSDLNIEIIDRCNLTILTEPGYEYLASFLAENKVQVTASLPCYLENNVDKQRGQGVFARSIKGLKLLNNYGYGVQGSDLILNLVFNPIGPILPPDQKELEEKYREVLLKKYDIKFTKLLALANMPINRFADYLASKGQLEEYKNLLKKNHNPDNLKFVMCKNSLSVDWNGELFDCDFNQQLRLREKEGPKNIKDLLKENKSFKNNPIYVSDHCFGCTAGSGSSCSGALV
tara:strand:- start:5181 stop:6119 length:939 start_codon:yes stop_codon:yes gene_type:complete